MNLNEIMKNATMKSRHKIMGTICECLSDRDACPLYEGVPCDECMKYSLEILLESIENDKK